MGINGTAVVGFNGTGKAVKDLSRFSTKVQDIFGEYVGEVNLNLGCGRNPEPGFINVDRVSPNSDVVAWDLEMPPCPPLAPDSAEPWLGGYKRQRRESVDCVLASHVLEHIVNIIPLMREIHRVLKPGGYLLACTPYASSDDAVEDPTHVRYFTERSWYYFDRRLYEKDGHAGAYASPVDFCFDVVAVHLVPYPEVQEAAAQRAHRGDFTALDTWKRNNRNVIKEMIAILRKVEG
ncbi:MAG TPA: methyltransferase domain-containing protein [Vicinamibacterales bacterium]|nr:methyltransferase domain-containing protein [Vicinamibacterales bacterium]